MRPATHRRPTPLGGAVASCTALQMHQLCVWEAAQVVEHKEGPSLFQAAGLPIRAHVSVAM